ncbi:NADAR family protein [Niveispirillum sp. KHB5.9]|uniref:NADAR family protein n=1 Tax=Niveispirillum sp. KHB5.9 TaxID=3400269 RepID=UPI003A8ABD1F
MLPPRQYDRFTFFWNGPFSQWHRCNFAVDGAIYNCAEQYMMAEKARLFGDEQALAKIMAAGHPRDQKAAGRRVAGFTEEAWNAVRLAIVQRGNRAKFTTHGDLLALLLETDGTELVEASPLDTIWGVGLAADDPAILDRANWRGLNLLGTVLTQLRDQLLSEQAAGGIPERAARFKPGHRSRRG